MVMLVVVRVMARHRKIRQVGGLALVSSKLRHYVLLLITRNVWQTYLVAGVLILDVVDIVLGSSDYIGGVIMRVLAATSSTASSIRATTNTDQIG